MQLPSVAPGDSTTLTLKLPKVNFAKDGSNGTEVLLTLRVLSAKALSYAPAGHEAAIKQFTLLQRGNLTAVTAAKNAPQIMQTAAADRTVIGNSHVQLTFDNASAALTSLSLDGHDIIAGGQGFEYSNHRWIENDRFGNTYNGLEEEGELRIEQENGNPVVKTQRKGSLCDTRIDYVIYPQGIVDVRAEFIPHTKDLRRAGLVCMLDSSLNNVNYYALGPWENACDRKDGVLVGHYATTVPQMVEPNLKPQSTGNREGLRELTLSDGKGFGVKIATEGSVNFSVLPYTDEDLMNASHYWNLQPRPYNVLHLDAWLRGIGNASCGQNVDTLPMYRVPEKPMSYKLRISRM